jgi:hypothetical protein
VGDDLSAFGPESSESLLDDVAGRLHSLAKELTSTRLVAPPHPTLVRPRVADPGAA